MAFITRRFSPPMDLDQNYFAENNEIGVPSPMSPAFGNAEMAPWYHPGNMCNTYADDTEDYMGGRGGGGGEGYSWSTTDGGGGGAHVTASPLNSISNFPTCISPTVMGSFEQQQHPSADHYPQWKVGEWTPTFETDDLGIESSGSDLRPPPPKKQKTNRPSSHRGHIHHRSGGKKPPASSRSAMHPPPPPIATSNLKAEMTTTTTTATPPSPPTTPPEHQEQHPQQQQQKQQQQRAVSQLRTASRKAKRTSAHKPAASEEERKSRASHNLVEKQYRNRLNAQFERLLAVLPPPGSGSGDEDEEGEEGSGGCGAGVDDRRLSKAEVLDIARRRIKALEKERDSLRLQNKKNELAASVGNSRDAIKRE